MKIKCSNCGNIMTVNGMGRKPLAIAGKNVYAVLQHRSNTTEAAEKLKVSRGWVNNWINEQRKHRLMLRPEFLAKYMPNIKKRKPGPAPKTAKYMPKGNKQKGGD